MGKQDTGRRQHKTQDEDIKTYYIVLWANKTQDEDTKTYYLYSIMGTQDTGRRHTNLS